MFFENEYFTALLLLIINFLFVMMSVSIPVYGYKRKRWKGLTFGCLAQPIVCALFFVASFGGMGVIQHFSTKRKCGKAMITVRCTESLPNDTTTTTLTWYLKADDECVLEKTNGKNNENYDVFDIIRLDSTSVCVEDRIVVKFDQKHQKATATDDDKPIEIVNIDWNKVNEYLTSQRGQEPL